MLVGIRSANERHIFMAAPDWIFDATGGFLARVLPLLRRGAGATVDVASAARARRTLDRLAADPRAAARSSTLVADLAEVVASYRAASGDMRAVIAGLTRVVVAVRAEPVIVPATSASDRLRQSHELALGGYVEVLALAEIAAALARLRLDSHDEARTLRARLVRLYDIAIERAAERGDIDAAMALRTTLGALSRDLVERGRPLARITRYETAVPLPAVVLAHELYQDAGRSAELAAENPGHDHPAFMPMAGRARSR